MIRKLKESIDKYAEADKVEKLTDCHSALQKIDGRRRIRVGPGVQRERESLIQRPSTSGGFARNRIIGDGQTAGGQQ